MSKGDCPRIDEEKLKVPYAQAVGNFMYTIYAMYKA